MLNIKLFRPAHNTKFTKSSGTLSLFLGATLNDVLSNIMHIVHEPDDHYRCSYWLIKNELPTKRGFVLGFMLRSE